MKTGDKIKVLKAGSTAPAGADGMVFWVGKSKLNNRARIGFKTETGDKHFIDADNCEITEPAPF